MVYPAQSPEIVPAPMPSCWFIFAGMWMFVYNYVSADSWVGFAEKINKKDYFLMWRWSIEIVPEISLSPCTMDLTIGLMVRPVERLYCKRPIQCLASSKILTPPHHPTAWRLCTPRLWCGGRTHSLGGEGVGGQYFGRRQTQLWTLHM